MFWSSNRLLFQADQMLDTSTAESPLSLLAIFMTPLLSITEKTIASLLIAWAGLVGYFLVGGIWSLFEIGIIQPMPFGQFVKLYHLVFLLPLLTIVSGFSLLFNKKFGWTLSLASLIINGLFFLIPTEKGKSILTDEASIIFFCSLAFLSLILFYILVRPAFRNKYNATRKTWLTIASIATLVLADRFILYLTS
jgi:hypothetical protein